MPPNLTQDLQRFSSLAFVRAADCTGLIRAFHGLDAAAKSHPLYPSLRVLYPWVFVPLSLWPVDLLGLASHLLQCISAGRTLDDAARLLCSFLPQPPDQNRCELVAQYEHAVKAGSYDGLINAQYKFD